MASGSARSPKRHHVVVLGGGFAGLAAVRALRRAPVRVTLVDRRNFHLFQPLLYQVATGGLSPANIASPLRSILRRQGNARVLLSEAQDIDLEQRVVALAEGDLHYDSLLVATGSLTSYFGHDGWSERAPGLKSIEDATTIRRRILLAFEGAESERDPARVRSWLTFVVAGGGPTGVEMAGTMAEIARLTLRGEFRSIDPAEARVILVEGLDRVLSGFPAELSAQAVTQLEELGVEVRTGTRVEDIGDRSVRLSGPGGSEEIEARVVVWAAGVTASPLGRALERAGSERDRAGRVAVGRDLSLPGHPEVFVLGDLALARGENGTPMPGLAPVAMQQGRYAARVLAARVRGTAPPGPFRYQDKGTMATIGRSRAVAMIGGLRLSRWPAWLAWLFIHLLYLVEFQNRVLVLFQWAWNYVTFGRSARLITEER